MRETTDRYWELASQQCNILSSNGTVLSMDDSVKNRYEEECSEIYNYCKRHIMKKDVENLDRHKVAAILVAKGLELDIVKWDTCAPPSDGMLFIGAEKLLLVCAVHYLAQQINELIKASGTSVQPMKIFILPKVFSCNFLYIDILSRLLHTSKEEKTLSVLELADKFFLMEYIAILDYYKANANIVFDILKTSESEKYRTT